MRKHFGFTLAEVLITLGIIGVVAAMTMPALINQTNGAQYKAAYKKAVSAISQAIALNYALDDWDLSNADGQTKTFADKEGDDENKTGLFNKRMNVARTVYGKIEDYNNDVANSTIADHKDSVSLFAPAFAGGGASGASSNTTLFLNDGIMFTFVEPGEDGCTKPEGMAIQEFVTTSLSNNSCLGYIDVNGIKGPNKQIKCDKNTSGESCKVSSPTDIYPVAFFDQTVAPATPAARAVLYNK